MKNVLSLFRNLKRFTRMMRPASKVNYRLEISTHCVAYSQVWSINLSIYWHSWHWTRTDFHKPQRFREIARPPNWLIKVAVACDRRRKDFEGWEHKPTMPQIDTVVMVKQFYWFSFSSGRLWILSNVALLLRRRQERRKQRKFNVRLISHDLSIYWTICVYVPKLYLFV